MKDLRRKLAKEIINELEEEVGITLPLSLVIDVIKSQGTAIKFGMERKEKIKLDGFGSFQIDDNREETLRVYNNLVAKGFKGDELNAEMKRIGKLRCIERDGTFGNR